MPDFTMSWTPETAQVLPSGTTSFVALKFLAEQVANDAQALRPLSARGAGRVWHSITPFGPLSSFTFCFLKIEAGDLSSVAAHPPWID